MQIRALDTLEDVRTLEGMLADYIHFVCDDLKADAGVTFDAAVLTANTLNGLHKVVPPLGRTFVAEAGGVRLGMVFLRPSGPEAMEIKRLYVLPEARGTGAGRALLDAAVAAAKAAGARALRLDTARSLRPALALYGSMGFAFRDPYPESDHFEDPVLGPYLVFMEKPLG